MPKNKTINVKGTEITITNHGGLDYISLTDILRAKDGDFFLTSAQALFKSKYYLISAE